MPPRRPDFLPPRQGQQNLTVAQEQFIEWLTTPKAERQPPTLTAMAKQLQVTDETLRRWRHDDPWFRKAWEKRCRDLNLSLDRIQEVIDAAYKEAVKGNVKAMELYLKLTEQLMPPTQRVVIEDKPAKELTDEQLAEQIRENLAALAVSEDL